MSQEITQESLNTKLWAAADSARSKVDAGDFKDYVLSLLFFKYLSDLSARNYAQYKERYGNDVERIEDRMKQDRFYIPDGASFEDVYAKIEADNIGEEINMALRAIEQHNRDKIEGVFRSVDFNSEDKLGKIATRNAMIRNLLQDFHSLPDLSLLDEDLVGESYMYMIERFGANAGKKAGEFFTVREVARLVARLAQAKPGDRICDPACGAGGLLLMTGEEIENQYNSTDYALYGQEAIGTTYHLARMNMFLHGKDAARIEWGDTLGEPQLLENDQLMQFDTVVANPPFSLKKWGAEAAESDRYHRFHRGIPPKDKGDYAFITHMIETARPQSGRVVVIVPHGVLFRGGAEGKIRKQLLEENLIDAVIGLPAGLFSTTGIPVAILVLDRSREKGGVNEDRTDVLFIEASKEYKQGKAQNILTKEHRDKIYDTYTSRKDIEKFARVVDADEIVENDYNLNITRYVDTFEEEEPVDIQANMRELEKLEPELEKLEQKMQEYLKVLEIKK